VLFDDSEGFLAALDQFDATHYPQTRAFGSGGNALDGVGRPDEGDTLRGRPRTAEKAVVKDGRPVTGMSAPRGGAYGGPDVEPAASELPTGTKLRLRFLSTWGTAWNILLATLGGAS
jgi:hypothetical protein